MKEKFEEKLSMLKVNFEDKVNKLKVLSVRGKKFIIQIITFVFLAFVIISISNKNYTRNEVLNNFKFAIENKDAKLLSKTLKVDGKRVDSESLLPLISYYEKKKDALIDITKKLNYENNSGMLELKSEKNLFGETYYLDVNKISVKVESNFNDTEVFINNKSIKAGETLEDIIPGDYIAKYRLNTYFGEISGEKEVTVTEETNININVDAVNITLYSDYKNADVYIDNKNIQKKVSDIVDFGPIPLNKGIDLYIEHDFPWGKIKSEKVSINNGGIIKVDINMVNEKLMSEIDTTLNSFFNSVFAALNQEDKSLIKNADESTKNKIYEGIFKKTLFFTNNYEISDMNLNIEKSEFKNVNEIYKGNVVVKINYDIYKKILPFIKESREEMFLVNLVYDNGTWISTDIQRFNIYDE